MKKYITLTILFLVFGCVSLLAQYHVNYIGSNGESMTFRAVGYGKNAKIASVNAELNVIKAIMFEGIPNSQQRIPMVPEIESVAMDKHGKILNDFFNGEYQSVITQSIIVNRFGKDANKQKSITLEVTVNLMSLRNKLEKMGVIRKFGL